MSKHIDPTERTRRTEIATAMVVAEVNRITARYAPFNSAHEGYAIILEELDEVFDDVKRNDQDAAVLEAVQVAATAIRFITDLGGEDLFRPEVVESPAADDNSRQGTAQASLVEPWTSPAVAAPSPVPENAAKASDEQIEVEAEVVAPIATPAPPPALSKLSGLQNLLSSVNRK